MHKMQGARLPYKFEAIFRLFHLGEWLVILCCVIFIVSLSQSVYSLWKRTDLIHEREKALAQVKAENKRLKDEVVQIQTPEFIEREARNKLGLTKPGEQVILFERQPKKPETGIIIDLPEEKPSLSTWWKVFF